MKSGIWIAFAVLALALARPGSALSRPPLGSSLSLGRCGLGPERECFDRLLLGLLPEDRPYVRLSGRKVIVGMAHSSRSGNFQALREAAGAPQGRTIIEVLRPDQSYSMLTQKTWPNGQLVATPTPMGSPRTKDGFEGYTFFPYRGKRDPGILYSAGPYTLVAVNTDMLGGDTVTESIYHELRHVILGGFGTTAVRAEHGLPAVEAATQQAEQEAKRNERVALTR